MPFDTNLEFQAMSAIVFLACGVVGITWAIAWWLQPKSDLESDLNEITKRNER